MSSIEEMVGMNGWNLLPNRDCVASPFMVRQNLSRANGEYRHNLKGVEDYS